MRFPTRQAKDLKKHNDKLKVQVAHLKGQVANLTKSLSELKGRKPAKTRREAKRTKARLEEMPTTSPTPEGTALQPTPEPVAAQA